MLKITNYKLKMSKNKYKPTVCGACRQQGHNRRNKLCPMKLPSLVPPREWCDLCEGQHRIEGECPILEQIREMEEEHLFENECDKFTKDKCSICLSPILKTEAQACPSLSCVFHSHCLVEWNNYKKTCPMCNKK